MACMQFNGSRIKRCASGEVMLIFAEDASDAWGRKNWDNFAQSNEHQS